MGFAPWVAHLDQLLANLRRNDGLRLLTTNPLLLERAGQPFTLENLRRLAGAAAN